MRSMAARRMCAAAWCLYGCLQLCSALELPCNVTQAADGVTYSISDGLHALDVKALKCEYSWVNESNHVLANHLDKMQMVIRNSINTLVTSTCFDNVLFRRSCLLEGRDYTANCTTSCRGEAWFHQHRDTWIVIAVMILVLVGIVILLCCIFKDRTPRVWCCGQVGGCYTSVKQQDPKAEDVELGNK